MTRVLALFLMAAFCFTFIGCHTIKGASEGAKKDWQDSCNNIQKSDKWIKKNLW